MDCPEADGWKAGPVTLMFRDSDPFCYEMEDWFKATGRQNVDPPQSRRRENLPSSYIPGSFHFTVFAQNQQVVAADTAEIYGEYGGVYWQRLEIRDPTATGSAVRRFIRTRADSTP